MFIVLLAVVALAEYVIIFYSIVNMVAKPADKLEEEEKKQTVNNADVGFVCEHTDFNGCSKGSNTYDKEITGYIEEQNYRIALLSFNVAQILSNIDAIVERNKAEQRVSL